MTESSTEPSRQPRSRWWRGRVRVILALGLVAGLGIAGTQAYWSDQATLNTGPIQSGTLDLTLDGALTGQGGTTTKASFSIADLIPGESIASATTVANDGSVALTYTAEATATGALAPALTFQVYSGGTASNTGSAATGDRTGSCSGTSESSALTLTSTPAPVIATARTLTGGSQEVVCVVATLATSADNSMQGESASASFVFAANQLGA